MIWTSKTRSFLKNVLATVVFFAITLFAPQSAAQISFCTERDDVLDNLSSERSEETVAMGIANNGGVIEVLNSETGASWTIIITMPNNMTCTLATGENWEFLPKKFILLGPPT